ncbi:hypothetical protein BJF85_03075 [Saccharomonospora sp. CUA-673]|uniref:phosphatase PAP2 family protein n=1 Tax=Saccharomonospora sp. CUA-673 TaxID=1904969 RepID=UPI00095BE940|nr:phosphatase PAP2 family protein [Saccharomonospora sp. CUA-673]OLT43081.1 hypothetical protein BJF85_03075 [Saccharomonospora sp. CUA-673]
MPRVSLLGVPACLAGWLVLGLLVAGGTAPTPPDAVVEGFALGLPRGVLTVFTWPTLLPVVAAVLLAVAVTALRRGRPEVAALAVLAPALAITVNTFLSKPLFDRWYDEHLAYPSGHTVSLVTAVTVLAAATAGRVRTVVLAVGAVLTALAAVGMAGLGYHYVTDVVGGAAFAVAVTTAVWWALNRFPGDRPGVSAGPSPRRRGPGRSAG